MKKAPHTRRKPVVEEIEPRILYSADFSPGLLAAAPSSLDVEHRTLDAGGEFAAHSTQSTPQQQVSRHEVVFVDTATPDYQKLVDDIKAQSGADRQLDVVLLDPNADGIKQISTTLAGMQDVSAVHLIGHGTDGEIALGGATLNFDSLVKNAAQIKGWGQALTADADLLIYGCDVAQHADGKALVDALGRLTGADVAASVDLTGSASLGGDWDLEFHVGSIETPIVFSQSVVLDWNATLLGAAAGSETVVNSTTAGAQATLPNPERTVAVDAQGNYVVVWQGNGTGDGDGIFARRFNASGVAQGSEFRVNNTTGGTQQQPSVAMAANGDFVVVWSSPDGNGDGVYARRFDAAGAAQGSEFQVSSGAASSQGIATVGMNASGAFVVAWTSTTQDSSGHGVYAQRYNAAGAAQGSEFRVNVAQANDQDLDSVALDASGNFLITWSSNLQEGGGSAKGIYSRRFDSAGAALTGDVHVNTFTAGDQFYGASAMNATGDYVVTWTSMNQDGGSGGIYGQRFNSAGAAQGGEFRVNGNTSLDQEYSKVSMDSSGNFVVTWSSFNQDGGGWGIYKQEYNANGSTNGGEVKVNATTTGDQIYSTVAMSPGRDYVVVWSGNGAGDGDGVFAQRYAYPGVTVTPTSGLITTEAGGTATFTVVLDTAPSASVTVALTSADTTEGTISTSSLVFTTGNWNVARTVTITGVDDALADGNIGYTIVTGATVSADASYNGLTVADVSVTNSETAPSEPARTVNEDASLVFSAAGGNAVNVTDGNIEDATLRVQLTVTNGIFTLSQTTGLTFVSGANGSSTMTVQGLESNINAALAGSAYAPTANYNGSANLQVTTMRIADVTAEYTFDSAGSLGTDVTGNYNGTVSGASGVVDATRGNVINLAGAGYVQATGRFGNPASVTLAAWVKLTAADTAGAEVISLGDSIGLRLDDAVGGVEGLFYNGSAWENVRSFQNVAGTGWHYVAYTFDNTSKVQTLYLDGVALGSNTASGAISYTQGANSFIGKHGNGQTTYDFNGRIDDARIYSRALSAAEIAALAADTTLVLSQSVAITVNAVNDAPVNTVPAGQSINEDTPRVFSSGNGNQISIADLDAGSVRVSLTAANGLINLNGTTGLSFTVGDGTTDATMTFTGTVANINTALNGLSFAPTLNFNGAASLQIVTNDLGNTGTGGAQSDTDTVAITVNAVNDAPVNTVPGAQSTNEDTARVFSSGNGNLISIADVDAGSVQVTLTATNGLISLIGTGLTFTTGDGTADGTMTFTGTVANINTALNGLSFAPTLNFNGAASLQIVTNDQGNTGTGGAQSDTDTVAITVNAVNDAPVNTVPGAQSTNEDTARVFSSGNGNLISIADVDAGSVQVTLTAANGLISLIGTGLTFTTGDGTADGTMTFTGTVANINTALNGLSFAPTLNFNGAASLQIVTNDQGNTGTGGAQSDTDTVAITVNAVNDAPVNTVPGAQSTNEDTARVFSSGNGNLISIADVDAGSVQVTLTGTSGAITLAGLTGLSFTLGDGTADAAMTFTGTVANINTALNGLSLAPTLNFNGAASLQIVTNDQGNTGTGGAQSDTDTVAITVNAVNDAPVNTVPGAQSTNEDTARVFSSGNGNQISIADVDAGSVQVTLTAANGLISLIGTGLTFTTGDGTADGTMTFTGTVANINTALNGLSFAPTANFSGAASLQIITNDQGNTGTGGAQSDTDTVAITVNPINDAPTIANLSGDAQTYVEGTAAVVIEQGNDAAVADVDSADFNGGALTVAISAGGDSSEDVLSIRNQGVGAGQIGFSAGNVTYGGVLIGTASGGSAGTALTVTLNASATPTALGALVRNVTYVDTDGVSATTGTRTIGFTLTDGDGGTSSIYDTSVNVTSSNGQPTAAGDAYAVDEDSSLSASWWDTDWTRRSQIVFTGNNFGGATNLTDFPVLIALDSGNIDYSLTQNAGQDLRFLDANGTPLAYQIESWNESGTSYVWVKVPQVDVGSADFISMYYGNASAADGQNPTAVWASGFSAVYHLNDSAATIADATANNFDGTAVNGAAAAAGTIAGGRAFDGTNDSVDLGSNVAFFNNAPGVTVSAWVNTSSITGGSVLLGATTATGGASGQSRLSLERNGDELRVLARSDDSTVTDVSTTSNALTVGAWRYVTAVVDVAGNTVAVYVNGAAQSTTGTVNLPGTQMPATDSQRASLGSDETGGPGYLQGSMDEVRFSTVARSAQWVRAEYLSMTGSFVTVGAPESAPASAGVLGNDSDPEGDALSVTLVSGPASAAAFTLNADGTFTYTPQANFAGTDTFTYRASDGTNNSNVATVTITVNPINDEPGFTLAGNQTVNEDAGAQTVASFASGLPGGGADEAGQTLAYTATNDNNALFTLQPTIDASGNLTYTALANASGSATVTVYLTDNGGTANGGDDTSPTQTFTITVNAVNDAPAISAPASIGVTEDVATSLTGISFSDIDAAAGSLTATFTVGQGNLSATSGGGVVVGGSGTNRTLSGSLANLNAFVAAGNLLYTTGADDTTSIVLGVSIDDQGNTGTGGAQSASTSVTLTVAAVNDAPGITAPGSIGVTEDAASALTGISFGDVDSGGASLTATFTVAQGVLSATSGGGVTVSGSGTSLSLSGSLASLNGFVAGGNLLYTTATDDTSAVTLGVSVDDQGNSGAGGAQSTSTSITLTVTAVNDEPDLVLAGDLTVNEGAAAQSANGFASATPGGGADEAGQSFTYTVGNNNNALFAVQPTIDAAGNLTYTPAADASGIATVTVFAIDSGGTAGGGDDTSSSLSFTIAVDAVNDAPVNTVPAAQSVNEDTALVFAGASQISIADIDAAALPLQVTLSAANGVITLSGIAGLAFTTGDGTGDGTMTFTGSLASINAALNGLSFASAADFSGAASLTVATDDQGNTGAGGAQTDSDTVTITVNPVNDAPVAAADAYALDEDGTLNVAAGAGVLANDADVDGPALSSVLVSGPASGALTLNVDGSFSYTPNADFSGADSFTYQASDGTLTSAVTTVTLTVNPVNDAPVATADAYTLAEDGVLNVASLAGVLSNDTDIDGPALNSVLVSGPASGALTLNADGSFSYTPNADFSGADSFTYQASDGTLASSVTTVTLTVNPVNDAPVASADAYALAEDGVLNVAAGVGVLVNDSDVDGPALSSVLVSGPASGALTLNVDGSFSYTPNADFSGADSFTYRASDGTLTSAVTTVTLTVNGADDAPVASADGYVLAEDGVLNVAPGAGVLANDTDVDGPALSSVLVSGPASGALILNADGSFSYTPNADFSGADSFTYQASDGTLSSAVTTVALTVNPVNDAPVAAADAYALAEDGVLNVAAGAGLLANDADVDGPALNSVLVSGPASGALTLNADGSFSYTPNADFSGADSFIYRASDGTLTSAMTTVTLTVNGVNDAPVAAADAYALAEDGTLNVATGAGVLANDSDVDGPALNSVLVSGPASGALTLNADGSFSYTPNPDFSGADSFTYQVSDGTLTSAVTTVALTVNPVNDAPVATADAYALAEDGVLNVAAGAGLLANDADVDGPALNSVLVSGPASGALTLNADGSFSYTPNADFSGADSFTYQASDGTLTSAVTTVTLTVNPVNDAPAAIADAYALAEDGVLNVAAGAGVLANDSDVDGPALNSVLVSGPASGALTLNADGSFTYTPAADFNGVDSFVYQASDGTASSVSTTVTINVAAVNDAPVLGNDTLTIMQGGTVVLSGANLSAADIDSAAGALLFTVSNVADGQFELVAAPGVAVTTFTQGAVAAGQVRFVHDGSSTAPGFDLMVSDGTLSAGPTAASIVFSVPAAAVAGPGPVVIVAPPPPPPAPVFTANPPAEPAAPAEPTTESSTAAAAGEPEVVFSPGRVLAAESVGVDLPAPLRHGLSRFVRLEPSSARAGANPAPSIQVAEMTLLIQGSEPTYMEFGPSTLPNWSAHSAFPDEGHGAERDQIKVIMESVEMGGLALSVGVVWWASRVGGLIGSLLASMPAWRHLDPLPIMSREEDEEEGDQLQDADADADELAVAMVLEGSQPQRAGL